MDSISTMPDEILCHILSFLPSKDAIRTSILSSRWTNLMTFVPVLSFESPPTRTKSFMITLNKLLSSSNSANLGKLKLHMNSYRWGIIKFHINGWINSAIKRNVVSLDVRVPDFLSNATQNHDLALRITASDSLQILKYSGGLRFLMPCTTGSFKNLNKFKVELNDPDKELLAKLFCSLPQLEKLSLKINFSELMENDMNISINIIVPALKRLSLSITQNEKESVGLKILIDVPLLEYISIEEDYVATYLVKSPPAVVKATLYVCQIQENLDPEDDLDLFYRVVGLLDGLSSAKSLSIVRETTLLLQVVEFAESGLPLLHGLTYLELDDTFLSGLALIPTFLDSAPNLKKVLLTILEEYDSDFHWTSFSTIPTSLLNIEEFEIVGAEKVQSVPYWKEMADDIIQNAKVLKKFVVDGQDWCSIA